MEEAARAWLDLNNVSEPDIASGIINNEEWRLV
jgi:hypothetical protein